MKLVFLFVEKFKLFSQKEFNLDSEYLVHYDPVSCKLEINRRQALMSDFWHVGAASTNTPVVESVSAIVGENGSGKTTFAQILLGIFRLSPTNQFNYIAIFKIGQKFVIHHSPTLSVVIASSIPEVTDSVILSDIKYCYYSPIYTTERDRGLETWEDGGTCYDLSTTGLLKSYTLDVNTRDRDIFTAFDIDEKRRVLEFISHFEDVRQRSREPNNQFPIRYPEAVWLEIDELDAQRARNAMEQMKYKFHNAGEEPSNAVSIVEQKALDFLDRMLDLSSKLSGHDFFIKSFLCYGLLHLYDLNLTQFSTLVTVTDDELLLFMKSIADSQAKPAVKHKKILNYLEKHPPMRKSNGRIVGDLAGKTVFQTFLCLKELIEMPGAEKNHGMIGLDFKNPDIRTKLLKLAALHGESSIFSKFLRFSFPHAISSGEMAFLSMFSRLYECFSNFAEFSNAKDSKFEALVLLDEAETALHPSFQRKLVYNAIWFFETFFPNAAVHLIFASHSPILLSDIPKSNCEFLVRPGEDGKEVPKPLEFNRLTNTFGANIFDLYRLSFFMEDGTVGHFASQKIDSILKKLETAILRIRTPSGSSEILMQEEDFALIEEIKSLIGDRTILKYIEIALRSIKNTRSYVENDALRRH